LPVHCKLIRCSTLNLIWQNLNLSTWSLALCVEREDINTDENFCISRVRLFSSSVQVCF